MDPALETLIHATSEEERQRIVERLVEDVVRSVVDPILRRLVSPPSAEAHRDLRSEVLLRLLSRLRLTANSEPIGSLPDYAAVVTYHVHATHLRHAYPERARLKDRLRYVLGRDERFDAVASGDRTMWRLAHDHVDPIDSQLPTAGVAQHAANILRMRGGAMTLDDLVNAISADGACESPTSAEAAPDAALQERIENVEILRRLWSEILALPLGQRIALLLSLRDAEGDSVVLLLPVTGVATVRQIASALEFDDDRFAALWNNLPINDAQIAALLGRTPQQVIGLRKSARERLVRRMSRFR